MALRLQAPQVHAIFIQQLLSLPFSRSEGMLEVIVRTVVTLCMASLVAALHHVAQSESATGFTHRRVLKQERKQDTEAIG